MRINTRQDRADLFERCRWWASPLPKGLYGHGKGEGRGLSLSRFVWIQGRNLVFLRCFVCRGFVGSLFVMSAFDVGHLKISHHLCGVYLRHSLSQQSSLSNCISNNNSNCAISALKMDKSSQAASPITTSDDTVSQMPTLWDAHQVFADLAKREFNIERTPDPYTRTLTHRFALRYSQSPESPSSIDPEDSHQEAIDKALECLALSILKQDPFIVDDIVLSSAASRTRFGNEESLHQVSDALGALLLVVPHTLAVQSAIHMEARALRSNILERIWTMRFDFWIRKKRIMRS